MFNLKIYLLLIPIIFHFHDFETDSISIAVKANFIEVDNQENIYTVSENSIYKYDSNLNLLCSYSQNYYGEISSLDVSNIFKILVFFNDFSKIIILDNNLSEISEIDLSFTDFSDIQLICSSSQSGFWIYDNSDKKIYLLKENLKIQKKSKYLRKYINENEVIDFFEKENKIYLGIQEKGVLIFDNNGNFDKFVEFNLKSKFLVLNNKAFIYLDKIRYNIWVKSIDNTDFYISDNFKNAIDFKIIDKKVILTKDSLIVESFF